MIFRRPENLKELAEALVSRSEKSILAAGCTDILPQKLGKPWDADEIVDLTRVREMREIASENNGDVFIGAACTHAEIAENRWIQYYYRALAQACSQVGSVQIRHRGTIGGNVVNASAAADTLPCLMLFGARVEVLDGRSASLRTMPIEELSLEKEECVTGFVLPVPPEGEISAFEKLGDRDIVTIARIQLALKTVLKDGRLFGTKVVLGAAGKAPFFCGEAAAVLEGSRPGEFPEDAFTQALSRAVEASIPGRSTLAYKRSAVKGPAAEILRQLAEKTCS